MKKERIKRKIQRIKKQREELKCDMEYWEEQLEKIICQENE